tara:strand:- start:689 stop:1846 length:1158 start_codon:yes stop_codon:yes gene_type:complete
MIKQKLLVVGDFTTHIRSQQFIQKLLQRDIGESVSFVITISNPNLFKLFNSKLNSIQLLLNKMFSLLFFFELLIKIPFSHKILFLGMNHKVFPILLLANAFWRRPIIADMYISIYDAAKSRDLFNRSILNKLLTLKYEWYYKYLDQLIIEKPALTIYNGEKELKLIASLVGANLNKCNYTIIPTSAISKQKASPTKSDVFRICWWGTFMPFHGVDIIIKVASHLKKKGIDFTLNLFGTPKHEITLFEELSNELNLNNEVFFHKDKTFGNGLLEKHLKTQCDLSLGNFSSSRRALRIFPTKIIDSFSMNIPILTMDTEVIRDCADVDNEIFTCLNRPIDICAEIIKIINDPNERERRANNGFSHYERTFSEHIVQEQFVSLFNINP